MTRRIWVLGASDPEMEAIETLLRECGETIVHATVAGKRVHPGNAYRAECPAELGTGEQWDEVYRVECAWDWVYLSCVVTTIDHHRPGDPGYGLPPSEFFAASSIGQVIRELARIGAIPSSWRRMAAGHAAPLTPQCADGAPVDYTGVPWLRVGREGKEAWDIVLDANTFARVPRELVLVAAADHCLGAAYRGDCPGVDPSELARFRAQERARFQARAEPGITADVILERIAATQTALESAPEVTLAILPDDRDRFGQDPEWSGYPAIDFGSRCVSVRDMRRETPWPELPEAATRMGVGYMAGPLIGPDGRRKFTCSGDPEQVKAWMDVWAPKHGLVDIYGDPSRGFAGGYELVQGDE